MSGPPWIPGNTARSIAVASSARGEDEPAAGPAERLVGGGRHEVGMRERRRVDAGGDEPGDVGHVDEQAGPDAVGDRGQALEVEDPRVHARAGDEELRAHLARPGAPARRSRSSPSPGRGRSGGPRTSVPLRFTPRPWVRCPPVVEAEAEDPVTGVSTAKKAAWFAWAPECGCTLTWAAPGNSARARSWASRSTTSTHSQPP